MMAVLYIGLLRSSRSCGNPVADRDRGRIGVEPKPARTKTRFEQFSIGAYARWPGHRKTNAADVEIPIAEAAISRREKLDFLIPRRRFRGRYDFPNRLTNSARIFFERVALLPVA